jgi:hypothetical protein
MIKSNELRIGNYFKWISTNEIDTAKFISDRGNDFSSVNDVNLSDAIGIPLTEDILLKCGFEKSEIFRNTYSNGKVELYNQDNLLWFDLSNNSIEVKYLHTLQNLYFALTGEELQVNL